jgi:hypothetical protein
LTEAASKVGSNTRSQTAIAIPTALVDHGSVTATATAAQVSKPDEERAIGGLDHSAALTVLSESQ